MLADLADIQPFNLSLVVLGNDLNFFSLQFQDSYQDSYALFFSSHMGFLLLQPRKYTELANKCGASANPEKDEGKTSKNVKLLFCLPALLPIATFAATMKSLVSYWLALTVYEQGVIHLTTMRNNITSQKIGIIIV